MAQQRIASVIHWLSMWVGSPKRGACWRWFTRWVVDAGHGARLTLGGTFAPESLEARAQGLEGWSRVDPWDGSLVQR